jgi:hypothetical protein
MGKISGGLRPIPVETTLKVACLHSAQNPPLERQKGGINVFGTYRKRKNMVQGLFFVTYLIFAILLCVFGITRNNQEASEPSLINEN